MKCVSYGGSYYIKILVSLLGRNEIALCIPLSDYGVLLGSYHPPVFRPISALFPIRHSNIPLSSAATTDFFLGSSKAKGSMTILNASDE